MAEGPYLESDAPPGHEQRFAEHVATIGATEALPGLFCPAAAAVFSGAWALWVEGVFRPVVAPAIQLAHSHASRGQVDELARVDQSLSTVLSPSSAERSRRAAAPFFEGKSEMKAQRDWERYRRLVAVGTSPGHLPVVFAFHAALYHLPLAQTLLAYGRLEFERGRAGRADTPPRRADPGGKNDSALLDLLLPEVALALASNHGQSDPGGAPSALKAL